ncbi:MAG: hypothetical protein HN382_09805 [Gammaproteobacteria bacterium]|jgi:hypothetical protein|nr:hypothetical protein [Gammaproteobacteria bacterium]MBT3446286.1 hypothetical protein [Candidatus Thioglobus sp.]MBT4606113.1 hypothetical protein [Thiotrichales bacterium]MBT4079353.1 hypothetical protein [Gammaproteobacteria bacterium]MBT5371662.1 hypothetical protein [Gammaproteobacteria bacterium]
MKYYTFVAAFSAITLAMFSQVWAGNTVACPDISEAKQISRCSAESDLKHMFKVGCGVERNPSAKNPDLCDSYAEFKRRKNTALWESSDGEFMGYVACEIPATEIKGSKPISVAVSQKNSLYKVSCNYQGGIKFTFRTPNVCRVPGVKSSNVVMRADCSSDTLACKAVCD